MLCFYYYHNYDATKKWLFAFNNWTTLIVLPILPIVSPIDKVSNLISNFVSRRTRHANIACFVSNEFIHRSKGFQLIFVLRFMSWWQNVVEHILWGLERDNFLSTSRQTRARLWTFRKKAFQIATTKKKKKIKLSKKNWLENTKATPVTRFDYVHYLSVYFDQKKTNDSISSK